jgi:hypothetical protein
MQRPQARSHSPVHKRQGIADLWDSLVMGRVAGDELQAMSDGYSRNHGIRKSNGLTSALQVAPNADGKFGRRLIEFEDFLCNIHRANDFGTSVGVEDGLSHPV